MSGGAVLSTVLSILGLLADVHGAVNVFDTSRAVLRNSYFGSGTAVDLETAPAAAATLQWSHSSLGLAYSPRFTLSDVFAQTRQETLFFQTASLTYAYTPRSRYRFAMAQSVGYGTQSGQNLLFAGGVTLLTDPTNPNAPMGPRTVLAPKDLASIRTFSETTSVTAGYEWSAQWLSNAFASYSISGGQGNATAAYPRTNTVTAGTGLSWALSKIDRLASTLALNHSESSNDVNYSSAVLTESYIHAFSAALTGTVSAGLSAGYTVEADGTIIETLYPVASAGLTGAIPLIERRGFTLALRLGSSFAPSINPLTGTVQQTLQGNAALAALWQYTSVVASADATKTFGVNDVPGAEVVGAGIIGTQKLGKYFDFGLGYRTAWQRGQQNLVIMGYAVPERQWNAYALLTVRAPALEF